MKTYDYIIIGAGCAGLSLLMRIIDADETCSKKILLIDKAAKNNNDRTWCFWEKDRGYFEDIVYRKWNKLFFKNEHLTKPLDMGGYEYKMIRAIDFYNFCFERIRLLSNIEIKYADVTDVTFNNQQYSIQTKDELFTTKAKHVFSSLINEHSRTSNHWLLLQHFKGWIIETKEEVFNANEAMFMDFNIPQHHEAEFVYMLPLSERKALVEYTVFSKEILPAQEYDIQLENYITRQLHIEKHHIAETEFGIIPMTNKRFSFFENGIYNIGSAGGQTKASTGYTFQFIQKQAACISKALSTDNDIKDCGNNISRFHLYDSILLNVLCQRRMRGSDIFSRLFAAVPASRIFKFLDNETGFMDELTILKSMPVKTFGLAALREIIK